MAAASRRELRVLHGVHSGLHPHPRLHDRHRLLRRDLDRRRGGSAAASVSRPQFRAKHEFNDARVADGLKLMLWGFFKKVVIADRLAPIVSHVYGDVAHATPAALVAATLAFTFQIYCDFSGYSDIARGAAQVMGFELMVNFRRPYAARSIQEFWRRWHISLSTWFRDYVYFPLGGSRRGAVRVALNIMIVFLLSGLWHGANWTFVV